MIIKRLAYVNHEFKGYHTMMLSQNKNSWFSNLTPKIPFWNGAHWHACGVSDVGKVRENNQDNFVVNIKHGLAIVADGVGGHAGGELASLMAVTKVNESVTSSYADLSARDGTQQQLALSQIINRASLAIFEKSLEAPRYRGMATTTTLMWVPQHPSQDGSSPHAIVAHVGDSRCYLLRGGFLYQITDDHSYVNEQIKLGRLKPSDPLVSQIKNVITRCVGNQEEEEVDTFVVEIFDGDKFLLCSDGLSNKVEDAELADYLIVDEPLENTAKKLLNLANERGGEDNITVLTLSFSNTKNS